MKRKVYYLHIIYNYSINYMHIDVWEELSSCDSLMSFIRLLPTSDYNKIARKARYSLEKDRVYYFIGGMQRPERKREIWVAAYDENDLKTGLLPANYEFKKGVIDNEL